MRFAPSILLPLIVTVAAAAPAGARSVVDFEGSPTGLTTGLEYVADGVVLSSAAGVREWNYGGAITEVVTSGDWVSPLEFKFVEPGAAATAAVTTSVSLRNHFGPNGPGGETDEWTVTSFDLAGHAIETKQLVGDGVLTFDVGAIHRVVVDDLNGTAFAVDDLTFATPSACGVPYGAGCPGSGGFTPFLSAFGCGGPTLNVSITNGFGGGKAYLVLGATQTSLPLGAGCELLVGPPVGPIGPLPLGGSGAGNGQVTLTLPYPVVPAAVTVNVQALLDDMGGPLPYSTTNGLSLAFEP